MAFKWNKYQGGQQPSLEGSLEEIRQKFQRFKGDYSLKTFVIILVLGFAAWTSWFTVQPEETGVVQRFGEVIRTADPGLSLSASRRPGRCRQRASSRRSLDSVPQLLPRVRGHSTSEAAPTRTNR
jgi:hypothetical protein